ncbi:hypothetical protein TNCV_1419121 [Trichonephila clavipes]|nr:hypothetical protein TNCV_1419121 [Trichonephila clavipes]
MSIILKKKKKKRNRNLLPLLDEVETDQGRKEPDEIMDINQDSESKFEKSNEHGTIERRIFKFYLMNFIDMKPQVYHKTHYALSKRPKKEKIQHVICRSSKDHLKLQ